MEENERGNLEAGRELRLVEGAELLEVGELPGNAVVGVHGRDRWC